MIPEEVMLAVDMVLGALIGPTPGEIDKTIEEARAGLYHFIIEDLVLYWAVRSVKSKDQINMSRFAELLKYASIQPSPWLGPEDRSNWTPSEDTIEHWRNVALGLA